MMSCDLLASRRAALCDVAAQIVSRGTALRVRVQGWSMYPCIKSGDVLEVEPVDLPSIRLGDVVLHRGINDELVAHRVVRLRGLNGQGALVTKGDWVHRADMPVRPEEILGRVSAIERNGKRIRFNTGWQRLAQLTWAAVSPHSRWLYLPVGKILRPANGMPVEPGDPQVLGVVGGPTPIGDDGLP